MDEAGTLGCAGCCYGNHRGGCRDGSGGKEGGCGCDSRVGKDVSEDEVDAGVGGLQGRDEEGGGGVVAWGRRGGWEQLHHSRDWGSNLSARGGIK